MRGRALVLILGVAWGACGARVDPARDAWRRAEASWAVREPGAWARWRALGTQSPDGREAARRLAEASAVYEDGIAAFERGDPRASETLRRGASIAPIAPSLYLRLARACAARGVASRAADFYRKYLAELDRPDPDVEAELAAVGGELEDPFTPEAPTSNAPWVVLGVGGALLAMGLLGVALYRRRRLRLAELLGRHPERAAAFVYLAGTLRHEVLKHRVAPLRRSGAARGAPAEPIERAWRRHVDALGAALGLPAAWVLREPLFRRAAAAIAWLDRAEQRGGAAVPDGEALASLAALDRALVDWCRLARRTRIDAAFVEGLVRSLEDEQPAGRLGVEVQLALAPQALYASVFHDDLLLVLRNVARNAIAVASAAAPRRIRIETGVLLDETGEEWVRIAVHDPSPRRPEPAQPMSDRGLGIVRDTLERYGGALVEVPPADGFEKALVVSLPRTDDSERASGLTALAAA